MHKINKWHDILFNEIAHAELVGSLGLVYVNSNLPKACASCLLKMTSFTFPDIFKRFSNVELRTARGSTSLSSRSWLIVRFFTTFPRARIVNRPRKNGRVFFIVFFPWVIGQSIRRRVVTESQIKHAFVSINVLVNYCGVLICLQDKI